MKKMIILVPLLIGLLNTISYSSEKDPNKKEVTEDNSKDIITVKKGNFISSIKIVGDIEAKKQIYIAPPFSAKVEKLAEDGEKTKKGALIAKLESKEQEDDLNEISLDAETAKNDLLLMEKDSSAELVKLNANILLAQKTLELKKMELKRTIDQPTKEETNKLSLNVELAKKALSVANNESKQKKILFNKGILKQKDLMEQKLTVAQKEKEFKTATAEYMLNKVGATEINKNIARLELKKSENSLDTEKHNLDFRKKQIILEKEKVKIKADISIKKLAQIKSEIAESVIKSPADGTVVISKVWSDKGLEKVKIGDSINKGKPFISIANLDDVIIKNQIEEQFIGRVKNGMICNITSSNLKGKTFHGKITKIGLLATEKKGREDIEGASKVFDLDIDLEKSSSVFRPGMSVDVEIILKSIDNVLLIPNKSIYKDGDKNFVYLPDESKKYIKLGLSNAKQSIVESGLSLEQKLMIEKDAQEGI
ncbi:MAG: efflux RND transporter periplasmic adaptor subunit [Candidatus Sericytochromatia bacterium]|nr:efflux RND transporter periplasmic adaptor subunit [Candidatus Sericytochromatia bacterium]